LIRVPGQNPFRTTRRHPGRRPPLLAVTCLALWLLCVAVWADDPQPPRHELSFPQRQNQYVQVSASWPVSADVLELSMPSWTPGSYLIRDFAGQVEALQAQDADGRQRAVQKIAKNRWRIDASGTGRLTVSYRVWAGELNVATSWVEDSGALLNGAGIFLYSEASRGQPQEVTLQLPEDWPDVQTALPIAAAPLAFRARDYDELIDSPIVAGRLGRYPFEVAGQPYALVLPEGNPLWDAERSRDDVIKVVEAQQAFWGVNPFDREYLFLNLFTGPFGGLEHDHSTVLMCDAWQMTERADYIKWLGLASHEFFHAWNVRRLRPAALARYDYDREMYTRELWLAEGLSSYYDDLLLFRAELVDVSEYFDLLAQEIRNYEVMPGRQVRSAEQASFDTYSINSTVSYYRKGALIGFVADIEIRRQTGNRASLDTVMRELYAAFGPGVAGRGGYPPGAFEDQVERAAGPAVRSFVESLLRMTDDPDVDSALEWLGLSLDRSPAGSVAAGKSEPSGFGVVWGSVGERLLAEQVILGRAGAAAGILPGDELLAIGGFRVTAADYAARIQRLRPGQKVELTLVRHQQLLELTVEVEAAIPDRYAVVVRDKLRRTEQQRLEAWLGRPLRFQ